jgi:hypothetical protein
MSFSLIHIFVLAFLEKKIKQRGTKCLLYVHQLNPDPGDNSIDFIVIIKLGLFIYQIMSSQNLLSLRFDMLEILKPLHISWIEIHKG